MDTNTALTISGAGSIAHVYGTGHVVFADATEDPVVHESMTEGKGNSARFSTCLNLLFFFTKREKK